MCTLRRNSTLAIVPPIIAAAMLSGTPTSRTHPPAMKPPFQSSGSRFGSTSGRRLFLEVVGEQREAEQQAEQVGQRDPFVAHVPGQAGPAGAVGTRRTPTDTG